MRFYGLSFKEVMEMTYEDSEMLWKAMNSIQAEETLVGFQTSSFPKLKKESRNKLWKSAQKAARPKLLEDEEKKQVSTFELAKMIARSAR